MEETHIFEEKIDRKILMKHNLLIQAKYNLSLVQNRIFELLLYHLQKEKDGILSCEIERDTLKQYLGKEKDKTIKGMSDIFESLRKKEILIAEKIEGKEKYKWHRYGLINGSTYNEDTDTFTVKATEEIYVLIQEYYQKKGGHTPINLIIKLGMNNYYAQRMYDLIRVWSGTKTVINYEVDKLKDLLQLNDKYPLYGDFKKRVLNPAIKELNNTGYFEITFKENRVSRKVVSIDFIVKDLDKRRYFDNKQILSDHKILDIKNQNKDIENSKDTNIYVPNKKLFTAKTLKDFMNDFKDYDFNENNVKSVFFETISFVLEKDDEEKIKVKSYNYFKTALLDRLKKLETKSSQDKLPKVKTRFHNINQTFTKYTPKELEKLLLENQKDKFKK